MLKKTKILPLSQPYLQIEFPKYLLKGKGIAGVESVYTIPQWGVSFDTGRAPDFAIHQDFLALTHFHPDHAGSLEMYLGLRCLNELKPLKILIHKSLRNRLADHLAHYKKLAKTQVEYEILDVDEVLLKPHLLLKAVKSYHCVPSQGYLVFAQKKKLKSEYLQKSPSELIALKNQGVAIDSLESEPIFAYSGDSTIDFLNHPDVQKAKTLLMECSFFADDHDLENVKAYGHTHIKNWQARSADFQNETIILTHTSLRYRLPEIQKIVKETLSEELQKRLIIFRK